MARFTVEPSARLVTLNTAVEPFSTIPLPNTGTDSCKQRHGLIPFRPAQTFSENYVTARVDHHFSDKDDIDAVFFYDKGPQFTPDVYLLSTSETFSERVMGGLEETHTFSSSLVNTARVGYNRTVGFVGAPGKALQASIGSQLQRRVVGGSAGPDSYRHRPHHDAGHGRSSDSNNHYSNSYQFYDDAFYTHGNHEIKFGVSVERFQYNELVRPEAQWNVQFPRIPGVVPYTTSPSLSSRVMRPSSVNLARRDTFFGGYVQDDWKFRQNLTLNLGLRYEMATLPTEAHYGFTVVP